MKLYAIFIACVFTIALFASGSCKFFLSQMKTVSLQDIYFFISIDADSDIVQRAAPAKAPPAPKLPAPKLPAPKKN